MAYTRTSIRLRSGQRTRLQGTVGAASAGPWNDHSPIFGYARAWVSSGQVNVGWAAGAAPPFAYTNAIAGATSASEVKLAFDVRGAIVLAYTRTVGGATDVMSATSYDDGQTFGTPIVAIAGGSHAMVAVGHHGLIIVAAYVSGNIKLTRQYPGDASPSAAITAQDNTGANLAVADEQFSLSQASSSDAPWVLAAKKAGDTAVSEWRSWDEGATWLLVS